MGVVKWGIGSVERAVWHPPYILLFGEWFIGIHNVETGHLVQVIPGDNIKCIWDDNGENSTQDPSEGFWGDAASQESWVHGVMNSGPNQHMFELIPKVPSPGLLAFPLHAS